jgi:hypothetical protein
MREWSLMDITGSSLPGHANSVRPLLHVITGIKVQERRRLLRSLPVSLDCIYMVERFDLTNINEFADA